jgi:tungstate transport system substrate-binding protein
MSAKPFTLFSFIVILGFLMIGCTAVSPDAGEPTAPSPVETIEEQLPEPAASQGVMLLATTTSTQDSGLLDFILPDFTRTTGIEVDVIAVGTGQAITIGEDGNADVLLVHARAREDAFMDAGHGIRREDVMYNDFVIIGTEEDPAGINGMTDAGEAFRMLAENEAAFISRGDDSGTHTKELSIWNSIGITPSGSWYISAGQGMGEVITMTNEQQAYTLSDRATYLARLTQGLDLTIVVEGDPILFNPYGVIAVNPEKSPSINNDFANQFIDWLISVPVQEKIAEYGRAEFGDSLFIPSSEAFMQQQ